MDLVHKRMVVDLSEKELIERGEEMSTCILEVGKYKVERTLLNKKIKPLEERVEELAVIIDAGQEERDVPCYWAYDWTAGKRSLFRRDTGEEVPNSSEPIPPHMKQGDLFTASAAASSDPMMFDGCPLCSFVAVGNQCAPILCGKTEMVAGTVRGRECDHPESERVIESNVISCGVCKTVISAAEITRESQPEEAIPASGDGGAGEQDEIEVAHDSGDGEGEGLVEEAASEVPIFPAVKINKKRTCCTPQDREVLSIGDFRILYCRKCGLVAKKEDTRTNPWARLDYTPGECVDVSEVQGKAQVAA